MTAPVDSLLARDAAARRAAQEDFSRPLLLEAGAGTGKTSTLVARVLAWSLGPGWEQVAAGSPRPQPRRAATGDDRDHEIAATVLGGIVAITFTEAAAAEMAGRVGDALAALEAGDEVPGLEPGPTAPPDAVQRRRAALLLASLDHLKVRTIHAFCRWLLARFPMEAGLDPEFQVDADESELEQVVREVVEARVHDAFTEPADPHLVALAAAGKGPPELAVALQSLAREAVSPRVLEADPFSAPAWENLGQRLQQALSDLSDLIGPRMAGGRYAGTTIARELSPLVARLQEQPPGDRDTLWTLLDDALPANLRQHVAKWSRRLSSKDDQRRLGDVQSEVRAAAARLTGLLRHVEHLDPVFLNHARAALAPLLAQVYRRLREGGVATYESLLHDARDLLADHPAIRRRVRREVQQLLVDEFQDTSPVQCDLVAMLALEGRPDERPGLFLVGDPKQSIYGWRDADLRAYDAFARRVENAGGRRLPLAVNFRSAPAILDEVQRLVAPVMDREIGLQPAFQRLLPSPSNAGRRSQGFVGQSPDVARVEHWMAWGEDPMAKLDARATSQLESAFLAADILRVKERMDQQESADGGTYAWSNFAVLLRSTTDLDVLLEEFRKAGVPYAVERDRNYYRRREVIDAAATIRAVLDPGDHLALVTMLRSPFVGVPDAAWLPLWKRRFPERVTLLAEPDPGPLAELASLVEDVAAALPPDAVGIENVAGWHHALQDALVSLAELRLSFRQEPADCFLEKMRTLLPMEIAAGARFLGEYRLANLDRFFRDMHAAMDEDGGNVQAILRRLRHSVSEMLEAEEQRPQEAGRNAVQVMTIHVSKGLGFDHVYLMQTQKEGRPRGHEITSVSRIDDGVEYRLFGKPSPGYDRVQAHEERVDAAERVRLLYVAATRAKHRLVISGNRPPAQSKRSVEASRSLQDLLQHRNPTPSDLLLLENSARQARTDRQEAAGAQWVFLAHGVPAARGGTRTAGLEVPPAPAPEARTRARARRRTREERPFQLAATAVDRLEDAWLSVDAPDLGVGSGEEFGAPGEDLTRGSVGQTVALAAGTAVHRILENLDLTGDLKPQVEAARTKLPAQLAHVEGAALRADALLRRFLGGELLSHLAGRAAHVLARELPVLLPPTALTGVLGPRNGIPLGSIVGSIDLLLRDPDTGSVTVVDYKTDRIPDPQQLQRHAAPHADQATVYIQAIRQALALAQDPDFELWFLDADRRVSLFRPGAEAGESARPGEARRR